MFLSKLLSIFKDLLIKLAEKMDKDQNLIAFIVIVIAVVIVALAWKVGKDQNLIAFIVIVIAVVIVALAWMWKSYREKRLDAQLKFKRMEMEIFRSIEQPEKYEGKPKQSRHTPVIK